MNEFFNPKVGLRALFSDPHWLAPYQTLAKILAKAGAYKEIVKCKEIGDLHVCKLVRQ